MGLVKNTVSHDRRFARSPSPPATPRGTEPTIVNTWKLGESLEAENGLKFASLTTAEGGPIVLSLEGCVAPFDPSSWQEETPMKNFDLRLDAATESKLSCMQACAAERFSQPKYKTDAFKPFLHKKEAYPTNLRAKLQTIGATAVRYWTTDKGLTTGPERHQGGTFDAKVLIKGVWYAADSYGCWGLSVHVTDLMLVTEPALPECPF